MARKYFKSDATEYTQKLADYAVDLKYENIPEEVIERAKMLTLHTLGVALAAKPIELSDSAVKIAEAANGGKGGESSVWLGGNQLSMASAAFANGTLADMLDWEDCAWGGHPNAGAIPVAMAVAEGLKKDGKSQNVYVVLGDGMAMSHARPEDGVLKEGITLLKIKNGVDFDEKNKIFLLFTLAAENNDNHQNLLEEIADLLNESEKIKRIMYDDLTDLEIYDIILQ